MLDENLPTFYLKPTKQPQQPQQPHQPHQPRHHWTVYLRQRGDEPEPAYSLRYLDPASAAARNRYAAALYDAYVPDVVYAEISVVPEWTQPTLSAEAIRLNGGLAPPPEPVLPSQFTVQLYNPDQQIVVRHRPKTWNSPATWEFEMPQISFRQPSLSTLDRTQSDPAVADVTPKLTFSWRRDSKLSKDLACLLSGKTTSSLPNSSKAKSKEPDITISIFKSLREMTLYEPNLYRVEMEDFKGLELVLLLGAVAIRDIYFSSMKETFHILSASSPVSESGGVPAEVNGANSDVGPSHGLPSSTAPSSITTALPFRPPQRPHTTAPQLETQQRPPRPAGLDPRSQWEIDAESARLRHEQERQQQEARKRAKDEERLTRKLLEAEEKARQKRQAEIEKETKRLQKLYGKEEDQARARAQQQQQQQQQQHQVAIASSASVPNLPPRRHSYQYRQHSGPSMPNVNAGTSAGPYLSVSGGGIPGRRQSSLNVPLGAHPHSPPARPQSVALFSGTSLPSPLPAPAQQPHLHQKKSSFFGFRKPASGSSGDGKTKLVKKQSSMF